MSPEQPLQNQALAGRRQIPISLGQLKRTRVLNVIGVPELIGLTGAALLALIAVFAGAAAVGVYGLHWQGVAMAGKDVYDPFKD